MTMSRLYNKNKKNELKHTQKKKLPKQTNKHEKKNSHCS